LAQIEHSQNEKDVDVLEEGNDLLRESPAAASERLQQFMLVEELLTPTMFGEIVSRSRIQHVLGSKRTQHSRKYSAAATRNSQKASRSRLSFEARVRNSGRAEAALLDGRAAAWPLSLQSGDPSTGSHSMCSSPDSARRVIGCSTCSSFLAYLARHWCT
jgi:hypothetical protein